MPPDHANDPQLTDSSINPPWWAAVLSIFVLAGLALLALQLESQGSAIVHMAYVLIALCAGVATFTFGGKASFVRTKASQFVGSAAVTLAVLVMLVRVTSTDRSRFIIVLDGQPAPIGTRATLLNVEGVAAQIIGDSSGQFWMTVPPGADPKRWEFNVEIPRYKAAASQVEWDAKMKRYNIELDSVDLEPIPDPVHLDVPKPVGSNRTQLSDALSQPPRLQWTAKSDARLNSAPPLELTLFRRSFEAANLLHGSNVAMTPRHSGLWSGELETSQLIRGTEFPHGIYVFRVKSGSAAVESDFTYAFEDDFSDLSSSFRSRRGDIRSVIVNADSPQLRMGPVAGGDLAWCLLSEDFAFPAGFVIRSSFEVQKATGARPTSLHLGFGNKYTNLYSITFGDPRPQDIGLKYRWKLLEPHNRGPDRKLFFDGRHSGTSMNVAATVVPNGKNEMVVRVFATENDAIDCIEGADCESFVASWKTDPREFSFRSIFLRMEVWGPGSLLLNSLTVEEWRDQPNGSDRSAVAGLGR